LHAFTLCIINADSSLSYALFGFAICSLCRNNFPDLLCDHSRVTTRPSPSPESSSDGGNCRVVPIEQGLNMCVSACELELIGGMFVSSQVMCKIYYFVWNMSYTASVVILTVIAAERYYAIMYPLRARHTFTYKRLRAAQAVIWLFAAFYNILYLFAFDTIPFPASTPNTSEVEEFCYFTQFKHSDMTIIFTLNFTLFYLIPVCLMAIMYSKIAITLWVTSSSKMIRFRCREIPTQDSVQQTGTGTSNDEPDNCACGSSGARESIQRQTRMSCERISASTCSGQCGDASSLIVSCSGQYKRYASSSFVQERDGDVLQYDTDTKIDDVQSAQVVYNTTLETGNTQGMLGQHGLPISGFEAVRVQQCRRESRSIRQRNHTRDYSDLRTQSVVIGRKKVIRLLVVLVGTFSTCVLPYHINMLRSYWDKEGTTPHPLLSPIAYLILYLNCALNPILYALFSNSFRRSFCESVMCRRFRQRNAPPFIPEITTTSTVH
jgi:hypothetical protein